MSGNRRYIVAALASVWLVFVGAQMNNCGKISQTVCVTVDGSGDCSTASDTEDGDTGGGECELFADCVDPAAPCVRARCLPDPSAGYQVGCVSNLNELLKIAIPDYVAGGTAALSAAAGALVVPGNCAIQRSSNVATQCLPSGQIAPWNECLICDAPNFAATTPEEIQRVLYLTPLGGETECTTAEGEPGRCPDGLTVSPSLDPVCEADAP